MKKNKGNEKKVKDPTKGILAKIESTVNKLPHPIYIFMILSAFIIFVSYFTEGTELVHPGTGKTVVLKSLASAEGFRWMLSSMIPNFVKFRPLGFVLVMMLGLGLAEETGYVKAFLRNAIVGAPKELVTAIVIFAGIMGNLAGSGAFVIVPPLGGLIFLGMKRNPLAGIAAGFAGVSAGLSANLLITGTDVLLAGITETSAQILDPAFTVHPAVNWFFMIASTVLLTVVGVFVTEKVVEPRLGAYNPEDADELTSEDSELLAINKVEKKGLRNSAIAVIIYMIIIAFMVVPESGILRHPELGTIIPSPFLSSMIPLLLGFFAVLAIPYGISVGTIKDSNDIIKHMSTSIRSFSGFIVLCFFAAQFIEYFAYTNLGLMFAVRGADLLKETGFVGTPLIIAFIGFSTIANFFIGSSSAKWAFLSPIFVPMFMEVGISPFYTQAAYRIADSVTNSISPLEPFLPFIIMIFQRYDKKAGLGTVISTMLPFAVYFIVSWVLLLILWSVLNLPLGPGAMMGM